MPPEQHAEKLKQEAEAQVGNVESQELTPEQVAGDLASSYWTKRLQETGASTRNPDVKVQGGDFDMARSEAYLKNIREGNFFEGVDVSGTYDGEPTSTTESSVYDFFKRIADKGNVGKYAELFKDAPELVEKRRKQAEDAQKIVDAIEKVKPAEKESTPEDVAKNEVVAYFLNRLQKLGESMRNPDVKVQGGDFDIARCQAFVKQAREGKFLEAFDISGTYDGEPTKIKSSSVFDFFKGIAEGTEQYMAVFKDNPDLVEKRKQQGKEAQKIVDAILNILKNKG